MYVAKFDPTGTTQIYSIFLGTGAANDIAVDADGYAYVTGSTSYLPTVHALQPASGGMDDAFIAKINPSGTELVYSTYLGGSGTDFALGLALDTARNVYIVGVTDSTNFPTRNPYQATFGGGQWDVFVSRLNAAGSALMYSTYYGGTERDISMDIAVDDGGNAYITGDTGSNDFPVVDAFQSSHANFCVSTPTSLPCADVYLAKLSPAGVPVYSTYLGGNGTQERGVAITVDSDGSAYITGYTNSSDFPVTENAYQPTPGNGDPVFLTRFNPDGSGLLYSTYLSGTTGGTAGMDIELDTQNNMIVVGITSDTDFPTVNPIQAAKSGAPDQSDAFISALSADGTTLLFSTYFGGRYGEDSEFNPRIALDSAGSMYLTGTTFSDDFPILHAFQPDPGGPTSGYPNGDAFVAKIGYPYAPHAEPAQAATRNYFVTSTPTLTWTQITGVIGYHVQMNKNQFFAGTSAFEGETAANEFSITTTPLDDGLYYWRVKAQKADGNWGGWSPVESFTIDAN